MSNRNPKRKRGTNVAKAPKPKINIGRLYTAMDRARLALRQYRQERLYAVKQYVGTHWSEETISETVPLNLLNLYCRIVIPKLVSRNPRVMLSTFNKPIKPQVAAMESWVNKETENQKLDELFARTALDALFTVGVTKVALCSPADSAAVGWNIASGQPFAERVDFDDFVFDIHARNFDSVSFIGHRIRVPLDSVKNNPLYSAVKNKLTAQSNKLYNQEGDERINTFGRTTLSGSDESEYLDWVDLWEIYLPHSKQVITLADKDQDTSIDGISFQPLRVQEWLGPDCGPYHILKFVDVPGNIMPIAPIMQLVDLHDAVNNCLRKLIRQGKRQKEVTLVTGGKTEDGQRVMRSNDGEMIPVADPQSTVTTSFGGPNQQLFALMQALQQLFSWLAGNLDSLGGLSPQAKTASQDQMLSQNASGIITDMQGCMLKYVSGVMKALGWYWWNHPTNVMKTPHSLPGLPEINITRTVTPADRQKATFADLDIQVDPYSLQPATPQTMMSAIMQVVTQVVVPMQPLLMQQGIYFDINAFLVKIAKFNNIPDLNEIITIAEPPAPDAQDGPAQSSMQPGKPSETTRNYVRESMPGRTPQGDAQNRINTLMGVDTGGSKNGQATKMGSGS